MLVNLDERAVHHDDADVEVGNQVPENVVEDAGPDPSAEPLVDRPPFAEPLREIAPVRAIQRIPSNVLRWG